MSFLDYLKGGIIGLLVGMILAGVGVWWAKDQQVKAVKVELQAAKDANQTNQETIKNLKDETENLNKSCTARIQTKDKTIRKLKEIDSLKPGEVNDATGNNSVGGNSGDSILDALNGMWDTDNKDGVRPAGNTGTAGETGLLPGEMEEGRG